MSLRLARELGVQHDRPPRPTGWRNSTENRTSPGTTLRLFGGHQQLPHRAAAVLAAGAHHAVDQVDDPGGAHQRVLAGGGRRRAGMAVLADRHRVVPDLRLGAGDDADLLGLALQDRALLDMQLEIRVGREGARRFARRDSRWRPARCRRSRPRCRSAHRPCRAPNTPAQTPEPIRLWPKRLPSSSVQLISSSGASVTMPRSFRLRITSRPASTPSAPSNLPPEGWLSRWLPNSTGRRVGSRPARRANMLPIASTRTVSPSGLAFGAEAVAAALVDIGQGQAADAALRAWRRSPRSPSGCPTDACRRCVGW